MLLVKYYEMTMMSLAPTPRHEVVMSEIDDTVHEQVKGQRILVYICISVSESEE